MFVKFLTREQEMRLAVEWHDKRDVAAKQQIVEAHYALVSVIAKKFRKFGLDMDDLIQEGYVGLMIAIDKFDPSRGNRFSTVAKWWVMSAMQDFVFRNYSIVRGPTHSAGRNSFFAGKRERHVSLFTPIGPDSSSTMADILVDEGSTPDEIAERRLDTERSYARLQAALGKLPARSRDVLERRLGEDKGTLEQIAKIHGISKERVRQIEMQALEQVLNAMNKPH